MLLRDSSYVSSHNFAVAGRMRRAAILEVARVPEEIVQSSLSSSVNVVCYTLLNFVNTLSIGRPYSPIETR